MASAWDADVPIGARSLLARSKFTFKRVVFRTDRRLARAFEWSCWIRCR
jgi:hypothetical protein